MRGLNRSGDKDDLPLLRALAFAPLEPDAILPPMPLGEHVIEDYRALSLSLKGHPIGFLRARAWRRRVFCAARSSRVRAAWPSRLSSPGWC